MASGGRSDGVSGGERSSRAGQGDDDGTDAGSGPSTTAASSRRSSLSADGEEGTSESGTGPSAPSQNSFTRDGDGEDAEEGGDASSAAGEDAGSGSDAAGAASSAAERLTPVFVDGSADGGSEGGGGTDRSGAGGIAGGGAIDPASLAALTGGGTAATDPSRAAEGARGAAAAIMRTLERAPNARAACSTDTTSDEYLDHYDIPFYVRDAVEVLLATRPAAPLEALHTYFRSVLTGGNIANREFGYINATVGNRLAWVTRLDAPLQGFGPEAELLPDDALEVVRLLCADVPSALFLNAAEVMGWSPREPCRFHGLIAAVLTLVVFSDCFAEAALFCLHPTSAGKDGSSMSGKHRLSAGGMLETWPLGRPPWLSKVLAEPVPAKLASFLATRARSRVQPLWVPPLRFVRAAADGRAPAPRGDDRGSASGSASGSDADGDALGGAAGARRPTFRQFCHALCANAELIAWVRAMSRARAMSALSSAPVAPATAEASRPGAGRGSAGGGKSSGSGGAGGGSARASSRGRSGGSRTRK